MIYEDFIRLKQWADTQAGFTVGDNELPPDLFPFQRDIVRWALKKGRAGVYADTGLGKTAMQAAWANCIHQRTGNRVLILAPLCVAQQTEREALKFGVRVRYTPTFDKDTGIWVTNYERLAEFEGAIQDGYFAGVALDESSILKSQDGKTRQRLINTCAIVPYRLSCSATPSPNDHMELGSQSEFLGLMSSAEMLSMFFTHDSGETSKWRLKGHAKARFWEWMATWAVCIRRPSDLGFDDSAYALPPLNITEHIVQTDKVLSGSLMKQPASTLSERIEARRITVDERVAKAAAIANATSGPVLIWCNLNDESAKLARAIPGSVEVSGSDKIHQKESKIMGFTNGETRVLITKPSIAGFGMNWQHCADMAFVGLNDSFEELYQAIRRSYRFGQTRPVNVHMISADLEGAVLENLKRKERQHEEMAEQMVAHMREFSTREVNASRSERLKYAPTARLEVPPWLH